MNVEDSANARTQEHLARGWASSCWARAANLERRVKLAAIAGDSTVGKLRAELEVDGRLPSQICNRHCRIAACRVEPIERSEAIPFIRRHEHLGKTAKHGLCPSSGFTRPHRCCLPSKSSSAYDLRAIARQPIVRER
jgi:hypothetical protein